MSDRSSLSKTLRDESSSPALGLFMPIASPEVVELCGHIGFQFVIFDAEYESFTARELAHLIRASENCGMTAIVRMPLDPHRILVALDANAEGIQIPHCTSVSDLRMLIDAVRLPPVGGRTLYNLSRSGPYADFDFDDRKWMQEKNESTLVGITIEDHAGVEVLDDLLATDEAKQIDFLYIGKKDLWASLGMPTRDILEQDVDQAIAAATKAKVPVAGTLRLSNHRQSDVGKMISQGYRMIAVAFFDLVREQSLRLLTELQQHVEAHSD